MSFQQNNSRGGGNARTRVSRGTGDGKNLWPIVAAFSDTKKNDGARVSMPLDQEQVTALVNALAVGSKFFLSAARKSKKGNTYYSLSVAPPSEEGSKGTSNTRTTRNVKSTDYDLD